jgi:hypothetical protein
MPYRTLLPSVISAMVLLQGTASAATLEASVVLDRDDFERDGTTLRTGEPVPLGTPLTLESGDDVVLTISFAEGDSLFLPGDMLGPRGEPERQSRLGVGLEQAESEDGFFLASVDDTIFTFISSGARVHEPFFGGGSGGAGTSIEDGRSPVFATSELFFDTLRVEFFIDEIARNIDGDRIGQAVLFDALRFSIGGGAEAPFFVAGDGPLDAVPIPAAIPLFLSGVGIFAAARRKAKA